METLFISILFLMCATHSTQTPSSVSINSENGAAVKRDISFSYAATDVGSHEGTHVKTLTVIKNIGDNNKKLWQNGGGQDKIEVPEIPKIPEELFSEFNIFLKHDYEPKGESKNEDSSPPETQEGESEIENSNTEELPSDGAGGEDELPNKDAEEIKGPLENVKSEKIKPSEERVFISSPILPAQAERSAKAQKERFQSKLAKSADLPKELFSPASNTKVESEKIVDKPEAPYETLFVPNIETKSEPLVQLPISFDYQPVTVDKTVFPTNPNYIKKTYQVSSPTGFAYKRDGIFIPKFSNLNYKPIKK